MVLSSLDRMLVVLVCSNHLVAVLRANLLMGKLLELEVHLLEVVLQVLLLEFLVSLVELAQVSLLRAGRS